MEPADQTARSAVPERRPRADALRNRTALLDAAREILGEGGGAFSLEAVARRAGVGIGTLYRHFPTREQLVAAVYDAEVDGLIKRAGELLQQGSAGEALRAWLMTFTEFAATKRGMRDALQSAALGGGIDGNYTAVQTRIAEGIAPLLRAGAEQGTLRSDVDAGDVVLLVAGAVVPHDLDPDQTNRLLNLILDALRP